MSKRKTSERVKEDEARRVGVFVRFTSADKARLDALVQRVPFANLGSASGAAYAAALVGLAIIEADPHVLGMSPKALAEKLKAGKWESVT